MLTKLNEIAIDKKKRNKSNQYFIIDISDYKLC